MARLVPVSQTPASRPRLVPVAPQRPIAESVAQGRQAAEGFASIVEDNDRIARLEAARARGAALANEQAINNEVDRRMGVLGQAFAGNPAAIREVVSDVPNSPLAPVIARVGPPLAATAALLTPGAQPAVPALLSIGASGALGEAAAQTLEGRELSPVEIATAGAANTIGLSPLRAGTSLGRTLIQGAREGAKVATVSEIGRAAGAVSRGEEYSPDINTALNFAIGIPLGAGARGVERAFNPQPVVPKIEPAPATAASDAAQAASQIKQQGGANAQATLTQLSMGQADAGLREIVPPAVEPSPLDDFVAGVRREQNTAPAAKERILQQLVDDVSLAEAQRDAARIGVPVDSRITEAARRRVLKVRQEAKDVDEAIEKLATRLEESTPAPIEEVRPTTQERRATPSAETEAFNARQKEAFDALTEKGVPAKDARQVARALAGTTNPQEYQLLYQGALERFGKADKIVPKARASTRQLRSLEELTPETVGITPASVLSEPTPISDALPEPTTASRPLEIEQAQGQLQEAPQVQAEAPRLNTRDLLRERARARGMIRGSRPAEVPASSPETPISPASENAPSIENAASSTPPASLPATGGVTTPQVGLEATPRARPLSMRERERLGFLDRKFTRTALSEAEETERRGLRGRARAMGEAGRVSPAALVNMAAPVAGAAVGATQGETAEERLANAAIGAALASGASLAATGIASRVSRPRLIAANRAAAMPAPQQVMPDAPSTPRIPQPPPPSRVRGAFESQVERGSISPDLQARTQESGAFQYTPLPNAITSADARAAIAKDGLPASINRVLSPRSDLSSVQRVEMSRQLIETQQDEVSRLVREFGEDSQQVADAVTTLDNLETSFIQSGTELGRAVQAYAIANENSPAVVFIRKYRKLMNEVRRNAEEAGVPAGSLPDADPKVIDEIRKRVDDIKNTPQDFRKREKLHDLYTFLAKQAPKGEFGEAVQAILYANILSGPQTQMVNFSGNLVNGMSNYLALAATNPTQAVAFAESYAQGLRRGLTDATASLRGSTAIRGRSLQAEPIGILERKSLPGPLKLFNLWKWVGRVMSATDQFFYAGSEELGRRALAFEKARLEGLKGKALNERVGELMGIDQSLYARAAAQAASEGLGRPLESLRPRDISKWFAGRNDRKRRIYEIVDQQRPMGAVEDAKSFALRTTYNNKPEGVAGAIAMALEGVTNQYPVLKFIVPFVRVPANVLNTMLDYTPVGFYRQIRNRQKGNPNRRPGVFNDADMAKAVGGTALMTYLLFQHEKEQASQNPKWEITGMGTGDWKRDRQLQAAGWRPYSIRVGDKYYSYKETPYAALLSWIGNLQEAKKYRGLSEKSRQQRAAYAFQNIPFVFLEQSFLKGPMDFVESISRNRIPNQSPIPGLVSKSASFLIPNLVNQTAQIFDPKIYDDNTIQNALVARIPVARSSLGQPVLNVFGKPVGADTPMSERVFRRFMSTVKDDPVYRFVAEKKAFVSTPSITDVQIFEDGKAREATPEEYYDFMKVRGEFIYDVLKQNAASLEGLNEEQAKAYVSRVVDRANKVARAEVGTR